MKLLIASLSLLIPFLIGFENAYGASWYDTDFNKARGILTDSADFDSTLSNYPLYVNVTSIDLGVDTQADCDDIVFVSFQNETKLNHEIENCDTTNDILEAWVNLPNAYSNGTQFFMYYNNPSATYEQNTQATWNSNFKTVWHLNGTFTSSTTSPVTCTNGGTSAVSDLYIGDTRSWDGANDKLDCDSSAEVDEIFDGGGTLSFWMNSPSEGEAGGGRALSKAQSGTDGWEIRTDNQVGSYFDLMIAHQPNSGGRHATTNTEIKINRWHHVAFVYDDSSTSNDPLIYINGTSVSVVEEVTPSTLSSDASNELCIGTRVTGTDGLTCTAGNSAFHGMLDEIRMVDIELSSAWINSDWECQRFDDVAKSCITVGAEETNTNSDTVTVSDEIALEDLVSHTGSNSITVSDEIALEDIATTDIMSFDTVTVSDEIALDEAGITAASDTVFVSDQIVLEDQMTSNVIPTSFFNAIILSLNSPLTDRLGGVFAITCPSNHTMTGIFINGTAICTDLSDFFP